jgi:hypothetical protein
VTTYNEAAWVLRRCFDAILESSTSSKSRRRFHLSKREDNAHSEEEDLVGCWQDETAQNTTDAKNAQCLADGYTILLSSITPTSHTRFTSSFENCFPGSEVVKTLVNLGLAAHRKMARMKGKMLRRDALLLLLRLAQVGNLLSPRYTLIPVLYVG